MQKFDAIVIGTGQAGPSIAKKCSDKGWKTAIIEKGKFGGTCVNTGCTPTKTMVASARVAFMARKAAEYGVDITGEIKVDLKRVKKRKDDLVDESTKNVEKSLRDTENLTVFEGHARFKGNHIIEINGQEIEGDKIFINVGTRPNIPKEYANVNVLTNASIMELEEVPEHLVIIGGSYIGLEFGQMFQRFGSKVTIIERNDRLIHKEDEDVSEEIKKILEQEEINFKFNANCIGAKMDGKQVTVEMECDGEKESIQGSHLLLAIGRIPNTDDLGLQNTDLKIDEDGYFEVDNHLKTNVNNSWAVGDCSGKGAFTHTAFHDSQIVTNQLFGDQTKNVSDRITCYGLFIDPPLGRIGMTEKQVKDAGINALITKMDMKRIARAREKGETNGFLKILVNADTKKILGANILGTGGDETIHLLLDAMYADQEYTVIKNAVHIHPTVAELIPTALENLKPL